MANSLCLNGKCSANSLSANGYSKLPGGLIIQWGQGAAGVASVTFPIPFPNNLFSLVTTPYSAGNDIQYYGTLIVSQSLTGFTVDINAGGTTKYAYNWVAIGD